MNMAELENKPSHKARDQYDRLEFHLQNWASWMRSGGMSAFHVQGGQNLRGYPQHYDTEVERDKSDRDTAIQVDAIIRDLKKMERDALNTEYLGHEWPNNPDFLGIVLVLAREQVQAGITRRCLY